MPPATISLTRQYIEARESTLGSVFLHHDRHFTIPRNQRPWAWSHPSKIQDLLNDFETTMKTHYDGSTTPRWSKRIQDPGPPHFFGTFVFYERENNIFDVFDGQQRITAISMLCAVFLELASDLERAVDSTQSSAVVGLSGRFREWLLVSPPQTDSPRLSPDPRFYDLFEALIFGCVRDDERVTKLSNLPRDISSHRTTKLLKHGFRQIREYIFDYTNGYSTEDKIGYLNAAKDVLESKFVCVETKIKSEPYAFEVFECLNARGVSLSEADKIKNELFKSSQPSDHIDISNHWNAINSNIRNQEVGEFLRRRYIALTGPCKQIEIYKNIKANDIDPSPRPRNIVVQWRDDSRFHASLESRDGNLFNSRTIDHLKAIFEVLGVSLGVIPLMAASKNFLPAHKDKFQCCASLLENFVFRQLTITKIKTPELESQLGQAARKLHQIDGLAQFESTLKNYAADASFKESFVSYATSRKIVQYYILRKIETHLLGGFRGLILGDHDSSSNTVEHILPRTLSRKPTRLNEWKWARDAPDLHKALLNKLGNLVILESDINRDVGSFSFNVKQRGFTQKIRRVERRHKGYCDSALVSPNELADNTVWTDWTEEQIEERQKQMADLALNVWRL